MLLSTQIYLIHEGSWLMLLRNKKHNDINHDKWIAVGGRKEKDETIEECAVRETFEETGLICDELIYQGKVLFEYDTNEPELIYIYTCEKYHGALHECNEGTLAWIKEDQIMDLSLWEGDRIFLRKMLEGNDEPFSITLHYDINDSLKEVKEEKE